MLAPSFMQPFAKWLAHPNLWHFNRRSVSGGVAIGLFIAFFPIPLQMLLCAIAAVIFRVNVALAVAMALVSNPFTMVPIFWGAYWIGTSLTGTQLTVPPAGMSFEWVMSQIQILWLPMLLGLLILGAAVALAAFAVIQLLWRWQVWRHLQKRRASRRRRESNPV
ncbi:DUF2062 domain-containing protein [Halothiobacillus sp. DCM-1]|uniref:DUF2062 domain-containing protein n=1 Tax=Halothiobacillus sp. DCM-1 TaxID=3112558 RepID=UPI003244A85F